VKAGYRVHFDVAFRVGVRSRISGCNYLALFLSKPGIVCVSDIHRVSHCVMIQVGGSGGGVGVVVAVFFSDCTTASFSGLQFYLGRSHNVKGLSPLCRLQAGKSW